MIPTSGNDREAQEKSPFPSEKPRKSIENGSSNPGGRSWHYLGDFPPEKSEHFPIRNPPFPCRTVRREQCSRTEI